MGPPTPSVEQKTLLDRTATPPTTTTNTPAYHDPSAAPSLATTSVNVVLYVLSGCTQPILMTVLRTSGLADPSCQLYMLWYYMGTASALVLLLRDPNGVSWPSLRTMAKASGIALWDIGAQTMNYTGAAMTGPAIFAIIYASVTVWAALYSQLFLKRRMDGWQWMAVVTVFAGLALTATDSLELGSGVKQGLILVILGSSMHGLFYVMSEAVMTRGDEKLSVPQNCAIQGLTASASFLVWQCLYTLPHLEEKLRQPMRAAGTSVGKAVFLLAVFALVSFIHSITFYHTLRHLPGGSTSAGVFKGLQAVLVFLATHLIYCGHVGGAEMCFTVTKFISLLTVSSGVLAYGYATSKSNSSISDAIKKNDSLEEDDDHHDAIETEPAIEIGSIRVV